jgi:hypothetical protein
MYQANGLGEVPDDMATAEKLSAATNDELRQALGEDSDLLPEIFRDLTLNVT